VHEEAVGLEPSADGTAAEPPPVGWLTHQAHRAQHAGKRAPNTATLARPAARQPTQGATRANVSGTVHSQIRSVVAIVSPHGLREKRSDVRTFEGSDVRGVEER
jgi:hypothetical protein